MMTMRGEREISKDEYLKDMRRYLKAEYFLWAYALPAMFLVPCFQIITLDEYDDTVLQIYGLIWTSLILILIMMIFMYQSRFDNIKSKFWYPFAIEEESRKVAFRTIYVFAFVLAPLILIPSYVLSNYENPMDFFEPANIPVILLIILIWAIVIIGVRIAHKTYDEESKNNYKGSEWRSYELKSQHLIPIIIQAVNELNLRFSIIRLTLGIKNPSDRMVIENSEIEIGWPISVGGRTTLYIRKLNPSSEISIEQIQNAIDRVYIGYRSKQS